MRELHCDLRVEVSCSKLPVALFSLHFTHTITHHQPGKNIQGNVTGLNCGSHLGAKSGPHVVQLVCSYLHIRGNRMHHHVVPKSCG